MISTRTSSTKALVAAALIALAGASSAVEPPVSPPPVPERIGSNEAAAIARSRSGGRVLDVRRSTENGRPCYLVRLLLGDGRVRTVVVDAGAGTAR